jgi:hypothetical protein
MRTEIYHSIETVDPHVWGKVTAGHPYAGCEWFAFGEAVLEQPGTYAVVFDGDEPIGGANFWVLRQEQLPLKGAIERRLMQAFLERRPLIVSRTSPCTLQRGVYLPDDPFQAGQVIGEIQRVGLEVAREHHASFLLADYLYDSDLDLSWGDYTIMRDFLDHGTKLEIMWTSFEDYLAFLKKRKKSVYRSYWQHVRGAEKAGIEVTVGSQPPDPDEALKLCRAVEAKYNENPYPFTRQVYALASMLPNTAYMTARVNGELVSCELLLFDAANGVLTPTLYGRDYRIEYAYFYTYYAVIRYGIEQYHARVIHGNSGAYDFKERLGFVSDMRNNLVFCAPSALARAATNWLMERID